MRFYKALVVVIICSLLFAGAGWAAQDRVIRFAGASFNPTGDLQTEEVNTFSLGDGTALVTRERFDVDPDGAFGFCLDFEQPINDRVGLGFTLMYSEPDIDIGNTEVVQLVDEGTGAVLSQFTESTAVTGSGDMTPLLIGPNFHFGTGDKVDLYAGPFLGYVFYGDITLLGERAPIDDDFAYGGVVGIDVPFGNRDFGFSAAARYLVTEAQPKDGGEALDVDPVTVQVGISYRF